MGSVRATRHQPQPLLVVGACEIKYTPLSRVKVDAVGSLVPDSSGDITGGEHGVYGGAHVEQLGSCIRSE